MIDAQSGIAIRAGAGRWRALYQGHVIADSVDALIVEQADNGPAVYFPTQDVATEYMTPNGRKSFAAGLGETTFYTLLMDGEFAENAAWTCAAPGDDAELLSDRLAFDPRLVEVYQVDDRRVDPETHRFSVDEVVRHTDAGDGHAQAAPWSPPPQNLA